MEKHQRRQGVSAYWCVLALAVLASIAVRAFYAPWYPLGYSGHSLLHYQSTRLPIYKFLFLSPWDDINFPLFLDPLFNHQHGPQSFIEAILTPFFGVGLTESRLIVAALGMGSILLAMYWGSLAVNRWFGLTVALALSFAPHHLIFSLSSESEHINVYWCTFLVLITAQLVLQRGRLVHFALLGLATGLTVYVYAPTIILGPIVAGLLLLFSGNFLRAPWGLLCKRAMAYLLPIVVLVYPAVARAIREGKTIPVRSPINHVQYEVTALERLWGNLRVAIHELFLKSVDPWFQRPVGAIADPTLFLLVPGILLLIVLVANAVRSARLARAPKEGSRSARELGFVLACVLAMTVCGIIPGIMSPIPYFRRLVLTGIGVTILEGAGLYAIAWVMIRYLGRIAGGIVSLAAVGAYGYVGWHAFRYDVTLQDNLLTFESVEIVREASRRASKGEGTVILLPQNIQKLYLDEINNLLRVEYGFDEAVPPSIRTIFLSTAIPAPMQGVIMPFDAFRAVEGGTIPKPQHFTITNPRPVRNVDKEVFVVVDLVPNQ